MSTSTFIMLKPDAIDRHLAEDIIQIFLDEGYQIVRKKEVIVDEKLILKHYEEVIQKVNQAYFQEAILKTFVGKKVIALELSSSSNTIIDDVRTLVGVTDPVKADKKSIRGRYALDSLEVAMKEKRTLRNLIHASDSFENAKQEMALWFGKC
ncbi:MAG: nucleoside-diphosphate kinase [Acholeplasmataceae bacterium]|jgi:nucleoside-diphosphate kinase|nr:nucleoside-diphosphate kinase [Acholeplasmataceae bacterium]